MEKEFEALKTIKIKCHPNSNPSPLVDEALEIVEQALTELQAIKEAKPSEALKGLEHIKKYYVPQPCSATTYNYLEIIEQALLKAQQFEKAYEDVKALPLESLIETYKKDVVLDIFTKEIEQLKQENAKYKKVLEIIKEKPQAALSLIQIGKIKTYEEYLEYTDTWDSEYRDMAYTQEEFELLKRWLVNEKGKTI